MLVTGAIFGQLTVINLSREENYKRFYLCRCECGDTYVGREDALRSGVTSRCRKCAYKARSVPTNKKPRSDIKDMSGEKFGRLTALNYVRTDAGTKWQCSCECGSTVTVGRHALISGATKSCGCLNIEVQKQKGTYYGETHLNLIFHYYKKSATKRKLDFNLTKDWMLELITKDCVYCATTPTIESAPYKRKSINGIIACHGIDRVDSSLGYIEGNMVPCCSRCNQIKMDMPLKDFITKVESIFLNLGNIKDMFKL